MGGHDQSYLPFAIADCRGNRLLAPMGTHWHTPPSVCVLAFHNGLEDRRITCASALTPSMTLLRLTKIW